LLTYRKGISTKSRAYAINKTNLALQNKIATSLPKYNELISTYIEK